MTDAEAIRRMLCVMEDHVRHTQRMLQDIRALERRVTALELAAEGPRKPEEGPPE